MKTFNFSVNYTYEVPIVGKEYYSVKRNEALPSFIGSTLTYLESWASSRNITINKNYITDGMDGYDENKNGIIIYQDKEKGTLVSNISSINVNVIKVEKKQEIDIEDNKENNVDINKEEEKIEDNINTILPETNITDNNTNYNDSTNEDTNDENINNTDNTSNENNPLDDIINVE